MPTPFDSLKTTYPKEYIDIFDITVGADNPLIKVTPLLDDRARFLPIALNIIVFTAPPVGTDSGWITADVDDCKAKIIAAYDLYTHYELHIYIQSDSATNSDPDNATALSDADTLLNELQVDLADYGFTYHGQMDLSAIVTDVESQVSRYYTETS